MTGQPSSRVSTTHRRLNLNRLVVISLGTAAVNLAMFLVGEAAGAAMKVDTPTYQNITGFMVVMATSLSMIVAGVAVWFASRSRNEVIRWARVTGAVLALVSIANALLVAEDFTTAVSLSAMHVFAAAAWYYALKPEHT